MYKRKDVKREADPFQLELHRLKEKLTSAVRKLELANLSASIKTMETINLQNLPVPPTCNPCPVKFRVIDHTTWLKLIDPETKRCYFCGEIKPLDKFRKRLRANGRIAYNSKCKTCCETSRSSRSNSKCTQERNRLKYQRRKQRIAEDPVFRAQCLEKDKIRFAKRREASKKYSADKSTSDSDRIPTKTERARERQRLAYQELKADPVRYAAYLERSRAYQREKYQKNYEKLKADPVRYAAYIERVRKRQQVHYHKHKESPSITVFDGVLASEKPKATPRRARRVNKRSYYAPRKRFTNDSAN